MGQSESLELLPEALESIHHTIVRQAKNLSDISSITYDQFLHDLSELNSLSRRCMSADGKQLVFVVKKNSDSSILWKATVRIACLKYDPKTQKMECCRLLNLAQFQKIFKTIKNEIDTAQQIDATTASTSRTNSILNKVSEVVVSGDSDDDSTECCICLERKQEITLPCTHSYCQQCISQWNDENNTCPVCREKMTNRNEEWLLSDAPNSAEINEYIATSLMDIATD